MKRSLLLAPAAFALTPFLLAQSPGNAPPIPPPVAQLLPRAASPIPQPGVAQRSYGPSGDTLISRQSADGILEGFKKAYKTDSAPRVVIYVNRALIDTTTGFAITARPENFEKTAAALKTTGPNAHRANAAAPALADQQTVREIERLFGRAFRHAGAQLADQKIAAALLPETSGAHLTDDSAAKDRKALADIADIAIEILISRRNLTVPGVSGDALVAVPDIQATAIRLKDATIVGQATASDIIGKGAQAGRTVRQSGIADITEATALALMEDMLIGKR